MDYVYIGVFVVLLIGVIVSLILGFSREYKPGVVIAPEVRRGRIAKGCTAAVLLLAIGVVFAITVFQPAVVRSRLQECEKITRDTFREKLGHEPEKIEFDATNRKSGDGWQYAGTTVFDGAIWDVTVTRDNRKNAGKTTLECEAKPRQPAASP